jgi:hypothetical protein
MIDAPTHDRARLVRQILLMPAVVMVLMTAVAPAEASLGTRPIGRTNSARTAAIAKQHAHAHRHSSRRWQEFSGQGRKVG